MRIGFDARLYSDVSSGIGSYTRNLIENLVKISSGHEYYLFLDSPLPPGVVRLKNTFTEIIPEKKRILWTNFYLPGRLSKLDIDLYHGTANFEIPIRKVTRYVVTIHDIIPKLFPELIPFKHRLIFNLFTKRALKVADKVITVSEHSKKDIVRFFNADENKIKVIYEAASEIFRPIRDSAILKEFREKYKLPEEFILFLGLLEPKKNIMRIIKSFLFLKEKGLRCKLVIGGRKGWYFENIFKLARELNLTNDIIFTGFVPEEDLPLLYNSSRLFVFPSLYEGFGLPVLEAMACGIPVITSRTSSLPEIAADAALYVDPLSIDSIVEAIDQVYKDEDMRGSMIERGIQRARHFSWQKAAAETLNIYREITGDF